MNKSQKGFAVLESLLIFIIIATISGVGWYAIHTKHQTDKILAQADKTSQSTVTSTKKTTEAQIPSQTFLTIKEWGVKIPLASDNRDAYYHIIPRNPDNAYVSIKSVEKTDNCQLGDDSTTGSGVIFRFTKDQVDHSYGGNQTYLSESPNAVKIGNYYYWYQADKQAVCSTQISVQDKVSAASSAFQANISKIQAQ